MSNPLQFTADTLLSIPESEPERLFTGDANSMNDRYRELVMLWHPDRNPDERADTVLAHINLLYDAFTLRLSAGILLHQGAMDLRGTDGRIRRIRYHRRHAFELGEMIYGDSIVAWIVRNEFADLFANARERIEGLRYANAGMEKEIARHLPRVRECFTTNAFHVMVMEKPPGTFLARDILTLFGNAIDARHVAWIESALHNIACYLEWAVLTHNDISPDTCFISPAAHSSMLLGGWWYAAPAGRPLTALPARSHRYAPPDILRSRTADRRLDLALIRVTGRELLGDITGMTLAMPGTIPQPMIDFLRSSSGASAREEYAAWERTLKASFGPRRFVRLDLSTNDIINQS